MRLAGFPAAGAAAAIVLAAAAIVVPRYFATPDGISRGSSAPGAGGVPGGRPPADRPQAPALVVQTGHTQMVSGLTFSRDGSLLASVSDDGTVKIWDVERGWELRSIFTGLGGWVRNRDVTFTSDGRWLVMSFTFRRTQERFKAWDVETGEELDTGPDYRRGTAAANIIREADKIVLWDSLTGKAEEGDEGAFSPDGRLVAISSKDTSTIALWEVAGRRVAHRIAFPAQILSFSPDGRWFSALSADAKTWRTWDARTFQEAPRRATEGGVVGRISPDGRWFAMPAGGLDLQELPDGRRVRCAAAAGAILTPPAFSPDSRLAASVISRGPEQPDVVSICDVASAREVASFPAMAAIERLEFGARGESLAIAGAAGLLMWDPAPGRQTPDVLETESVGGIAFSRDGQRLAWGDATGAITIRALAHGGAARVLAPKSRSVDGVAVSADLRRIAAVAGGALPAAFRPHGPADSIAAEEARERATVKVWDASGAVHGWSAPLGADLGAFTADGRSLVLATRDALTVHDAATGAAERRRAHAHPSVSRFSAGRSRLTLAPVTAKGDGGEPRERELVIVSGESGQRSAAFRYTGGGRAPLTAVSDDGRRLAVAMGQGGVSLIETATGAEIGQVTADGVTDLALSEDGRFLAVVGYGDAAVHDSASGSTRRGFKAGEEISALTFSPDGRWLALAGHTIDVFETATGRRAQSMAGHTQEVSSLAFSADGRWLVSGSPDGTVRLWDARAGALRATLVFHARADEWLAVTPEGFFDGSPGSWRDILWRFGRTREVAPVEIFFNEFYYPGLLQALLGGAELRAPRAIADVDRRQPAVRLVEHVPHQPDSRRVSLRIEVEEAPGAGAGDLRLFRNGSLVKAWRGDAVAGGGRAAYDLEVPVVSGANQFTAYAFNRDNVKSEDATLLVTGSAALARRGVVYVVAVGVDRYANAAFNLRYAAADARRFATEIEAQQRRLDPAAQVRLALLLDEDATRLNIRRALRRLSGGDEHDLQGPPFPTALDTLRAVEPEDTVVVFFSGHGLSSGRRFYLVPHDLGFDGRPGAVTPQVLHAMAARGVSDEDLERALEAVPSAATLLVIDACYSGQALESAERRTGPMNAKGLAQLAYEKGMYVLTAAQAYQVALETARLGHGLLTYALVEEGLVAGAADRAPRDRRILAREWLDFAAARVPELHRGLAVRPNDTPPAGQPAAAPAVQQPRVFYRRDSEARPFVVAATRPPS